MSVQKLSSKSKVRRDLIPFTQICNSVINNMRHGDSFLVWCYLQSKTEDWKVIKQDIKNNYGFGDEKLKHIFSYLRRAKLIEYVRMHCANGTVARWDILVLSGVEFDKNQLFSECATTRSKTIRMDNHTSGFDELLNKEHTKERKILNTKLSCASSEAPKRFDEFWNIYPRKKNKIRARKIWEKKKYDNIATLICEDVMNRIVHEHQWQDAQYIPHPETYLNNERWTDDITPKASPKPNGKASAFSEFANGSTHSGVTYDEHGNTSNPFN